VYSGKSLCPKCEEGGFRGFQSKTAAGSTAMCKCQIMVDNQRPTSKLLRSFRALPAHILSNRIATPVKPVFPAFQNQQPHLIGLGALTTTSAASVGRSVKVAESFTAGEAEGWARGEGPHELGRARNRERAREYWKRT
jgi:hypothetical protein